MPWRVWISAVGNGLSIAARRLWMCTRRLSESGSSSPQTRVSRSCRVTTDGEDSGRRQVLVGLGALVVVTLLVGGIVSAMALGAARLTGLGDSSSAGGPAEEQGTAIVGGTVQSKLELNEQLPQHQHLYVIELGTNEAIKQGVMAHLGVAVLPRLAVQLELASGLLASPHLPGFPLRRSWCTVYPKDRYPTPVTELFLRFVRELLPELNAHFKAPLEPAPGPSFVCLPMADH